jgi:hypothetical protein
VPVIQATVVNHLHGFYKNNKPYGGMPMNSEEDVLVVVSKLKNYIRSKADMNTSGNVAATLSNIIRRLCDEAVEKAKQEGRKTVMDRDFSS